MAFAELVIVLFLVRLAENIKQEATLPIEDVVRGLGYPLESVSVTTEDGYQLTLHRMRHGYHGQGTNRIPVLLMHGIFGSSVSFMATPNCLAYHLADRGFDVWMGNNRGTVYSKGHIKLNYARNKEYWNFSFHEMGVFDLPAMFKEIIKQTGVARVNYIGMSMGTTQFLVFGASDPANLRMVDSVILMAPVARPAGPLHSNMQYFALKMVVEFSKFIGCREVFKINQSLIDSALMICKTAKPLVKRFCAGAVNKLRNAKDNLDYEIVKEFFKYWPGGVATKVYEHFMQLAGSGVFRQYDNGRKNKHFYAGRNAPPEYNLSLITLKVYLLSGGNDVTATVEDVKWLKNHLPNAELISDELNKFTHETFVFGLNLKETLYMIVDDILEKNTADLNKYIDHDINISD